MSLCSCDVLLRREALSLSAVVVVRAVGTLLLDVVVWISDAAFVKCTFQDYFCFPPVKCNVKLRVK